LLSNRKLTGKKRIAFDSGENDTVKCFETLADNVFRQLFHDANLKKIE
jgi:hypothetical protein